VFSETTVIPNGTTEEQVEPAGFNDSKASQLATNTEHTIEESEQYTCWIHSTRAKPNELSTV
jgi:hypothetical protein